MKINRNGVTYAMWLDTAEIKFRRNAYGRWLTSCYAEKQLKRAWANGENPETYAVMLAADERNRKMIS